MKLRAIKSVAILTAATTVGVMRQWPEHPVLFWLGVGVLLVLRAWYVNACAERPEPGDLERTEGLRQRFHRDREAEQLRRKARELTPELVARMTEDLHARSLAARRREEDEAARLREVARGHQIATEHGEGHGA